MTMRGIPIIDPETVVKTADLDVAGSAASVAALNALAVAALPLAIIDPSTGLEVPLTPGNSGITALGQPYYDPAGPTAGEAAWPSIDPTTGIPVFVTMGG